MAEEIKKAIKDISINYIDGTSDRLQSYALAGFGGDASYHMMLSPSRREDKIRLNNLLVELFSVLLKTLNQTLGCSDHPDLGRGTTVRGLGCSRATICSEETNFINTL
jgi:hypothetical protein